MSKKVCMHFIVKGKVQGVWFRAATKRKAEEWQLTGYAKNLPDGSVEVIACGKEETLKQLHIWLQRGPELARVEEVLHKDLTWQEYEGFEVL